jgi:hypothetical protein
MLSYYEIERTLTSFYVFVIDNDRFNILVGQPHTMQNDAGERVDLYIPRKWYVTMSKERSLQDHVVDHD